MRFCSRHLIPRTYSLTSILHRQPRSAELSRTCQTNTTRVGKATLQLAALKNTGERAACWGMLQAAES